LNLDLRLPALDFEQAKNVSRGTVAKELAERLFVIRDAMTFDERNEVGGRVTGEYRLGEMRIGGQKVVRATMKVGEVTSTTTRDKDLLAKLRCTLEHEDAASLLGGLGSTHESGWAAAKHNRVV
jgi:hypothetical protein